MTPLGVAVLTNRTTKLSRGMDVATNPVIDLFEQRAVILAVLGETRPGRVACVAPGGPFAALLGDWAAQLGFQLVSDPAAADLVISAAGDYAAVHGLLTVAARRGATAVIGGVGWPVGRRDARADLDRLPDAERERFAHRLPAPGEHELSDVASAVAFAVTDGGPRNGVRTAVEDACATAADAWEVRVLAGFGGVAVLLPEALASERAWDRIERGGDGTELAARLEQANLRLRLERGRLLGALARHRGLDVDPSAVDAHLGAVERLLDEWPSDEASPPARRAPGSVDLERRLERIAHGLSRLAARHRERARALTAERARRAELAESLRDAREAQDRQEQLIDGLADELRDAHAALARRELELLAVQEENARELAYIREQAARIAQSGAWRWGHRLAMTRSRLLLRRTHGTDAVTRLLERVPEASPGPAADGAPGRPALPSAEEPARSDVR